MSKEKRYFHPEIGYNFRMTNIQAALGLAQLERINDIIDHRNNLYQWYKEFITISDKVRLNHVDEWAKSTYWMICLEIDELDYDARLILMNKLKDKGVDSRPYFFPLSTMPMYSAVNTPISGYKSNIGINLPTFFDLTYANVRDICMIVNNTILDVVKI